MLENLHPVVSLMFFGGALGAAMYINGYVHGKEGAMSKNNTTTANAEQRARELLAAEYEHDGVTWTASVLRNGEAPSKADGIALRAIVAALTQQPNPQRIVLWSRGVEPNWYFVAEKSSRQDIVGAPVYETLDEIVLRGSPQARDVVDVTDAVVERATMTLLGKSHDTAPGVDWRCDRAWTVNKVRKYMRTALTAALTEARNVR